MPAAASANCSRLRPNYVTVALQRLTSLTFAKENPNCDCFYETNVAGRLASGLNRIQFELKQQIIAADVAACADYRHGMQALAAQPVVECR